MHGCEICRLAALADDGKAGFIDQILHGFDKVTVAQLGRNLKVGGIGGNAALRVIEDGTAPFPAQNCAFAVQFGQLFQQICARAQLYAATQISGLAGNLVAAPHDVNQ